MSASRLPGAAGSAIDRSRRVEFVFDGRIYSGFAGDTIASALYANDVLLLSRSFKYHRPRGALTMAGQDANTLVTVNGEPNCLADRVRIEDGMRVDAQNVNGSLRHDTAQYVEWLSRFLSVGFYYHAFYRPRGIWNWWSRFFRRRAGLGVVDELREVARKPIRNVHTGVAVVGGGRSGLSAALAAADSGEEVILIDENTALGGRARYTTQCDPAATMGNLVGKVMANRNITVCKEATASGLFADNLLSVVTTSGLLRIRATRVVLAPGKLEQHAVFHNNDLPGVLLGSAVQRLVHLFGIKPGKRLVILTGNDEGYRIARDLVESEIVVAGIVDLRIPHEIAETACRDAVVEQGVPVWNSATVTAAKGTQRVEGVEIAEFGRDGEVGRHLATVSCDCLVVSVGSMPAYQLALQAGARLVYDDEAAAFSVTGLPREIEFVAARELGNHPWPIVHGRKAFVDFDEDLTVDDIVMATKRGYDNIQLVKRYSTCGMGPSQGRHSALPAARLVARATSQAVSDVGVTTARPPYAAETLGDCAGLPLYPLSRTAIHPCHEALGATFLQAGSWLRPAYYGPERRAAIRAEARAVRQHAGLIDVSTLGGIEVRGADAAEFLNRLYTFAYLKQRVGTVRYALMTNEAGVVIDDGVACRLADDHFFVTTTTTGIEAVYRKMLQWNAEWQLDVCLINVTHAWGAVNIAGPGSREILQSLTDTDLGADAFPYLAAQMAEVASVDCLLMRVGFVGELGFEIHFPQQFGADLWRALLAAGDGCRLRPVGIEAQRVLRLEKGHIIVGQDTDATSTPAELGMQWGVAGKKPYFVGDRSLQIKHKQPLRRMLAGFRSTAADSHKLREGHLAIVEDEIAGHITSVAEASVSTDVVGLALVTPELANGVQRSLTFRVGANLVDAEIVNLPFYDADNKRQAM